MGRCMKLPEELNRDSIVRLEQRVQDLERLLHRIAALEGAQRRTDVSLAEVKQQVKRR